MNAVPAVGVAVAGVTEKCVAGGGVVMELPPPQPLRNHKPEIASRLSNDFFMTPPQVFFARQEQDSDSSQRIISAQCAAFRGDHSGPPSGREGASSCLLLKA